MWSSWTYHTSHRGTRWPSNVLLSKLSPQWRMFLKGGGFFYSKVVVDTHFLSWWELLHNMPGMQSLKALLLFAKEQCWFLRPLHHHRSFVLFPFFPPLCLHWGLFNYSLLMISSESKERSKLYYAQIWFKKKHSAIKFKL